MDTKGLIAICDEVMKDVENDVNEFEGKPFTGKAVGAYMGYHAAAIKALAHVLKSILNEPLPTPAHMVELAEQTLK